MKELTPKMKRQRKALLVLPVAAVACLTVLFVALGGGSVDAANTTVGQTKGLNTQLPDAKLKDIHSLNKLSYYEQATLDSAKLKQQMRSDPYYHPTNDSAHVQPGSLGSLSQPAFPGSTYSSTNTPVVNQARVYEKLSQLQTIVNRPAAPVNNLPNYPQSNNESPLNRRPTRCKKRKIPN
jgi:hypothetical protein